jgi:hypothetical protein
VRWWRRLTGRTPDPNVVPDAPAVRSRSDLDAGGDSVADAGRDGIAGIEHNVATVIARLSAHVDFPFGLDRRSLVWIEGFLERQRDDPSIDAEALVPTLGSFLGQCLVQGGGGRWVDREEGWCVHSPRIDAFPFAKLAKAARHGLAGGESIVSFFDLVLETAHTPFPPGTADPQPVGLAGTPDRLAWSPPPAARADRPREAP